MLQNGWKSRLCLAVLGGSIGLTVLTSASARAQDTIQNALEDNIITRTEKKVFGSIMHGLGLRSGEPEIDYRERSPLVVPPTRDLPPPQASAAKSNPAWPVDPDVKRAKARADAKKKRVNGNFDYSADEGATITPTELNPPGASAPAPSGGQNTFDPRDGRTLSLGELGFSGFTLGALGIGRKPDEIGTFTQEPPRAALTAPPPGYQTPSPAFPYGVQHRDGQLTTRPADPAVGNP